MNKTLRCDLGQIHPGPYTEYLYKYDNEDRQGFLCEPCAITVSAWKLPERKAENSEQGQYTADYNVSLEEEEIFDDTPQPNNNLSGNPYR